MGGFAEALQLSTMADLDDIEMPPSAAQRVVAHFGKALPGGAELEPETTAETAAERQARERADALQALSAVPMADWSVEQVLAWADCLAGLPDEWIAALKTACEDEEIDGDELADLKLKPLQKPLKRAGLLADLDVVAQAVLAQRDDILAQQEASSEPQVVAPSLRCEFDRQRDRLGSGTFGHVFICRLAGAAGEYAVKRVDAIKADLVTNEIEALSRAAETDQGGHRNVVRCEKSRNDESFSIYVLCHL